MGWLKELAALNINDISVIDEGIFVGTLTKLVAPENAPLKLVNPVNPHVDLVGVFTANNVELPVHPVWVNVLVPHVNTIDEWAVQK